MLLVLYPVGAGAAIGPTRLYLPGQVNRATFQKQFFSERRLTRVRVRDDSEGTAGENGHGKCLFDLKVPPRRAGRDSSPTFRQGRAADGFTLSRERDRSFSPRPIVRRTIYSQHGSQRMMPSFIH